MKNSKEIERMIKGAANHHRIRILQLLDAEPELTLAQISKELYIINFKTTSEHVRRMAIAGLLMKRYEGNNVHHRLTPRGTSILKFLRIWE